MVEFRLVCLGTPDDVLQVFVSGEDRSFFETNSDLIMALVDVIAAYYVFDVSYSDSKSGILFFLQDVALEVQDNTVRGTKYSHTI